MTIRSPSSRQSLRRSLREARRSLTAIEQTHAEAAILKQLQRHLPSHTRQVAGYLASDGEISLTTSLNWCRQNGIQTSLPVIHPFSGKHLLFQQYHAKTAMTDNRFGIAEPVLNCPAIVSLSAHDCLLMPLVGFDASGNRLGMGGGFYDRTLAPIKLLPKGQRPRLIGIAHDCQQVATLPVAPWDIPLDIILTPTQCITQ